MSAKLDLDIDELKRLYIDELKTLDEIAIIKHTTKRTIANWLIRANIPRRTYNNQYNAARNKFLVDYFTNWSNQSAYMIGYIYADGSIDLNTDNSKGVSLHCAIKDREIIDGIANELKLTDLVKVKKIKAQTLLGTYNYEEREACSLRFYSNDLVSLLATYGIHPRKTWINYPMPSAPKEVMPHFLRGVFDGDGWASYQVKGTYEFLSFGFLGPELFITQLRDFLVTSLGMSNNKVCSRPGHFSVAWSTSTDADKLYNFMYPDGDYIYLARKMELMCLMSKSQKGKGIRRGRFAKGHEFYPRRNNVRPT